MAIINASTSAGLVNTGDTDGTIKLQANGTTIATISSTGLSTQVGAPAFSAYQSSQQTGITASTWTKINLNAESFDTNNNFASSRFTPTVAGYYQINGIVTLQGGNSGYYVFCAIYKNGSIYTQGQPCQGSANYYPTSVVNSVVYLNGSTDYVELYAFGTAGGSWIVYNTPENTNFNGSMIRSA